MSHYEREIETEVDLGTKSYVIYGTVGWDDKWDDDNQLCGSTPLTALVSIVEEIQLDGLGKALFDAEEKAVLDAHGDALRAALIAQAERDFEAENERRDEWRAERRGAR